MCKSVKNVAVFVHTGADDLIAALHDGTLDNVAATSDGTMLPAAVKSVMDEEGDSPKDAQASKQRTVGSFEFRGFTEERFLHLRQIAVALADRRRDAMKNGKLSFSGDEAAWLVQQSGLVQSVETADAALQDMCEALLLRNASDSGGFNFTRADIFRLQEHEPTVKGSPLNMRVYWPYTPRSPGVVSAELLQMAYELTSAYSAEGGTVDYVRLAQSDEYKQFSFKTAELHVADFERASEYERRAAFINIYNMLIIHGLCEYPAPQGTLQLLQFFGHVKYSLGGHVFSTFDIENGLLRNNSANPSPFARAPFKANDQRKRLCVPLDYRIHFALNCGALSCPPVTVYSGDNLDAELSDSAAAYLQEEVTVTGMESVSISKLFKFFKQDFGGSNEAILNAALTLLRGDKKAELQRIIDGKGARSVKVHFKPYNWTVNAARQ